MAAAVLSSQAQLILKPPGHFSTLKVQRGTISQLLLTGIVGVGAVIPGMLMPGVPMPGIPIPGMPIVPRSIIIELVMTPDSFPDRQARRSAVGKPRRCRPGDSGRRRGASVVRP